MKLTIEVTQADIDAAVTAYLGAARPPLARYCPVAQALRRELGVTDVTVGNTTVASDLDWCKVVPEDEKLMLSFTSIPREEWSTRCKPATLHFNDNHP